MLDKPVNHFRHNKSATPALFSLLLAAAFLMAASTASASRRHISVDHISLGDDYATVFLHNPTFIKVNRDLQSPDHAFTIYFIDGKVYGTSYGTTLQFNGRTVLQTGDSLTKVKQVLGPADEEAGLLVYATLDNLGVNLVQHDQQVTAEGFEIGRNPYTL